MPGNGQRVLAMKKLTDAQTEVIRHFHNRHLDKWHLPADSACSSYNLGGRLNASVRLLEREGYLRREGNYNLFLTDKGRQAFALLTIPKVEADLAQLKGML